MQKFNADSLTHIGFCFLSNGYSVTLYVGKLDIAQIFSKLNTFKVQC